MSDEMRAREIAAEDRALFDSLDGAIEERKRFEPTPVQARRLIEFARLGMMRKAVAAALVKPYEDALRAIEHYRSVESNPGWRLFWAGASLALEEVSERLGPRDVARSLADEGWRGPIAEHKDAARTASELIASTRIEGFRAGIERSWQPMHTAPRDGTLIDLLYPYPRGRTVNCFWDSGAIHGPGWFWRTPRWDGGDLLPKEEWPLNCYPNMEPTHWMPAPPMPTDGATHGDH